MIELQIYNQQIDRSNFNLIAFLFNNFSYLYFFKQNSDMLERLLCQPVNFPTADTTIKVKEKSRFFISAQCFEELVKDSNIFVDKSLFIKDIIEERCSSILITRPRRWGKTINLDMLKVFLEPDVDAHGTFNLANKPKTSVLFEGDEGTIGNVDLTATTFRPLKISTIDNAR